MSTHPIALVITDLDIGGAELCLTELALRLDGTRFEPVVYCLGREPPPQDRGCLPLLEKAGVKHRCLGAARVWDFPRALIKLRRHFLHQQPAVVQTFLFHANIVGRIAGRWAKTPWVVSGIRVAEHQNRWHLWLDRLTVRLVDRYVCVSESVAQFSVVRGKLPRDKMVVIPNGIDLKRYPAVAPADLRQFGISSDRRDYVCRAA